MRNQFKTKINFYKGDKSLVHGNNENDCLFGDILPLWFIYTIGFFIIDRGVLLMINQVESDL